jgi:hypothetical protein
MMRSRIITGLLLVISVIHLLPVIGFFGVEQLASLYGISIMDSNLEIVMRHRAILFGILGIFFAYAAFRPAAQPLAFVFAFISLASFFYLAFSIGEFNDSIRKVVIADVVASVCLFGAIALYIIKE